jgi:hypothetical protein
MFFQFLYGTIKNDLYICELKEKLSEARGAVVDDTTIWRALRRSGFRMKKISKEAAERNEDSRMAYCTRIGLNYTANQLIFVDESACDRRTYMRGQAWALAGQRACRKVFFMRGKR